MPRPDSPPTASKLERHCGRTIGTLDVSHTSVDAIDFLQPRLERQPQHLRTGQHPLCRGFADANHTRQHRHSATAPVRLCGRGLLSALAGRMQAVARPGEEPWDGDGGTCAQCTTGSAADATHGLRRSSPKSPSCLGRGRMRTAADQSRGGAAGARLQRRRGRAGADHVSSLRPASLTQSTRLCCPAPIPII